MSRTSLVGAFGLGKQSAKDTASTTLTYLPVTSLNLNPNQNVQPLPAEIGGDYFLRDSYKTSVSGAGDVGAVLRPNSAGQLFMALCGQDTVTPVPSQTGAFSHVFTPFLPSPGVDLPWYTLVKDVAKLQNVGGTASLGNQFLNAKLKSLRLDIPKSSIVTTQTSWVSTTPSSIDTTAAGAYTFDSSPKFQTCAATVSLQKEGGSTNISSNSVKVERFSMNYNNQMSEDEFSVGNYYLDDVTLLQRTVTCEMDFVIRDTALWQAVYQNGGAVGGAWDPQVYRGALTVTLNSSSVIATTTQNYQMILTFPGLDFLMLPIALQGADLVKGTLSTQVTLGPSGADRFSVTLINGVASY